MATIAVVGAAAIGGTIAYFSSQQVSEDNIIKAGTIDLQINHTAQTYNDVNCRTCGISKVSDITDLVVAKNGESVGHYSAVLVSNSHPAWTAVIPDANWIWAIDPISNDEAENGATYTFEKTFTWMGPSTGADLKFVVAADNSYTAKLNNNLLIEDGGEKNFTIDGQDLKEITFELGELNEGLNTLQITVQNWKPVGWTGTPSTNPGGLLYKLTIDGKCDETQYPGFAQACELWQTGEFKNQKFFNFDDVKPGDWGTNKISLTVTSNDANVCMYVIPAGTPNNADTALAGYINFNLKYNGANVPDGQNIPLSNLVKLLGTLPANGTKYVDVEWCFGTFVFDDNGGWTCNGAGNHNDAQGGQILADLGFYAEQTRHNGTFSCPQTMPTK